jgi:hypothetical protein
MDRPLKEVRSVYSCVKSDRLNTQRRADQFTSFILGGDLSLTADVHRAQIKAGLVGGEVKHVSLSSASTKSHTCKVYVAGFGPEDIQSVAVWFAPGRELLDTSVISLSFLVLDAVVNVSDSEEQKNAGFGEFMGKLKPETLKWWTEYVRCIRRMYLR